ncbi:hypothetical protein LPJ59_006787 [Coemansia sp. RSA 2399]|nr:hypothetical protein LPJ59_006787 [Coemansia sp. RSA 2399]KAJ1886212.1 hypothetical protein LPJ81_006749 [Coemansia sp. IMI 209127]
MYATKVHRKAASVKPAATNARTRYSKSTRSASTGNSSMFDDEDNSSGVSSTTLEHDAMPPLPAANGGGRQTTNEDFICAKLDQMGRRRLDSQCAQLKPPRQPSKQVDLSDILFRASKLTANRMSNQDFTPQRVRRIESLHRIAGRGGVDPSASSSEGDGARDRQHVELSPQRTRELFLANIATRLRKADAVGGAGLADRQRAVHPRDNMRSFLVNAIGKLRQLDDPTVDGRQRFNRPSSQQQQLAISAALQIS